MLGVLVQQRGTDNSGRSAGGPGDDGAARGG